MDDKTKPLNASQKNAMIYFAKAAKDETSLKKIQRQERAIDAAKTAKLRDLRLAKEAAELLDQQKAETQTDIKAPFRRQRSNKRPTVRFTY